MAYPDALPTNKTNATTTVDDHPTHHNDLATYVNTNVTRLANTNPQVTILEASGTATNASTTTYSFTSEVRDDGGWHDNATNPSRITVPAAASYRITGYAQCDTSVTGTAVLRIQLNGTSYIAGQLIDNGSSFSLYLSAGRVINLSANDYVELSIYQSTGSNRTFAVSLAVELVPDAQ